MSGGLLQNTAWRHREPSVVLQFASSRASAALPIACFVPLTPPRPFWLRRVRLHRAPLHPLRACFPAPRYTRRQLLRYLVVGTGIGSLLAASAPAPAFVDFDVNRYGDKEIRVSTLNRLKQNLRNVLSERPWHLEHLLRLALADALTYDQRTDVGGSSGTVRSLLGLFRSADGSAAAAPPPDGVDAKGAQEISEALQALGTIRRYVQDTSWADTIAFGGSVALEVTGGPRVKLQNGREDARVEQRQAVLEALHGYAPYWRFLTWATGDASDASPLTVHDIRALLRRSGLASDDDSAAAACVLVVGALGELGRIQDTLLSAAAEPSSGSGAEDADGDADGDAFDPTAAAVTYGKVRRRGLSSGDGSGSAGRGRPVAVNTSTRSLTLGSERFRNTYLKALRQRVRNGAALTPLESSLAADAACAAALDRLAGAASREFENRFAELLERATLLGARYSRVDVKL